MSTSTSVIIVTGVTGSGKTTVGRALAKHLGWRFHDADDLHAPENVERMRRGLALTDELRKPWLARVRQRIERALNDRAPAVIACSALKRSYRETLSEGLEGIRFVFLSAPPALLRQRLVERHGHFAGPELLESQLAALEYPTEALTLEATAPVQELVERICATFHLVA